MPLSVYESLAKEYLESIGYLVYSNLRFTSARNEVDIFAYNPKNKSFLVGEVKAKYYTNWKKLKKDVKNLLSQQLSEHLLEKYGVHSFERYFYCWNLYDYEGEFKKRAEKSNITIITYPEIIKHLFQEVGKFKRSSFYDPNRSNTILLQAINDAMLLNSRHLQPILEYWIRNK